MSFLENVGRGLSIFCAKVYDNRANIEFGTGMVLTGVGSVWLAKKTYDISDYVKSYKDKKEEVKDDPDELKKVNSETIKTVTKAVSAPAITIAAGMVLETIAHVTDRTEISEANATILGLTAESALLKNWIAKNEGDQKLREVLYGEKVTTVVDNETGEVKEEVTYNKSVDDPTVGEFAFLWGEDYVKEGFYIKDPAAADLFLKGVLQHYNLRNSQKGYWKLPDVLEDLGYSKEVYMNEKYAKAGNVWRTKDGTYRKVSFGFELDSPANDAFFRGDNDAILLVINAVPNLYKEL